MRCDGHRRDTAELLPVIASSDECSGDRLAPLIRGRSYRNTRSVSAAVRSTPRFDSDRRSDDTLPDFVQDEMTPVDDSLGSTAGSKFSWNDCSGFSPER